MPRQNNIQFRKGSYSQWDANSTTVLASGEPSFVTDFNILKIGDGTTQWGDLAAVNDNLITVVRNDTGSTIPEMSVVYINGAQGDTPRITLALAGNEGSSSKTYGLVVNDITTGNKGTVIVNGTLRNLNTNSQFSSVSEGTALWLSPTVSGGMTTTKPYAPDHSVFIGTYQIELTNGSQHVGANSEANNFPRLGIGTLITPFVNTALPVVPTNISVYFDEIYWDKNGINAGQVATLFGMMPGKVMAVIFGDAMTASAQSVMPALTTTALYLADPMTASAESGDHTVLAVLNNVETAAPMTASALMLDAARIDNTTISAAFMFASAIFNNAGTPRIVRIAPFNATAELANRRVLTGGITVNGIKIFDAQSPWVQFIKITNESSLLPMDGVR